MGIQQGIRQEDAVRTREGNIGAARGAHAGMEDTVSACSGLDADVYARTTITKLFDNIARNPLDGKVRFWVLARKRGVPTV